MGQGGLECLVVTGCSSLASGHSVPAPMTEQTQLVLYPCADWQPVQLDGDIRDVVSQSKAAYEPHGSVKGGVERISTFLNKAHQGIQLCLGDSEKL